MNDIKYVFFDIGYTLVNEDDVWDRRCFEQAHREEAKSLGLSSEKIMEEILLSTIAYKPQYRTFIAKYNLSYQAPYRHELEKLYDDANFVLSQLSKKYKLGIIANQTDGLKERLAKWGIDEFFATVISSWDYQIMKPDKRLFEIALETAGCKAFEAVMIGDRLDNDVYPAKELGFKTIWIKQGFGGKQFPKSAEYTADWEVNNLSEILGIL